MTPSLAPAPAFELSDVFAPSDTLDRVVNFIWQVYSTHGEAGDRVFRPGVITEQFFLAMPTRAAYSSEIRLCTAILEHRTGRVPDLEMREVLEQFLDTHTFVYYPDGSRVVKSGEYTDWANWVPLYYVTAKGVYNGFQIELLKRLEAKAGRAADYKIVSL